MGTLDIVTPPAGPAVTLAEVKPFCRIYHDLTDEDATLGVLIAGATRLVENGASVCLIARTLRERRTVHESGVVRLLWAPVLSVESLTLDGVEVDPATIDRVGTASYAVGSPGAALDVVYRAGYGETAADVPDAAKNPVLLLVAAAYETRSAPEAVADYVKSMISALSWGGEVAQRE